MMRNCWKQWMSSYNFPYSQHYRSLLRTATPFLPKQFAYPVTK